METSVVVNSARVELVQGDLTTQEVEAIGNAANTRLAGGGGVDGAIHRAGGPAIMSELKARYPQGCPTGQAVITGGGRLKAKHVIHAVGPVYSGRGVDAERLASAYRASLELCARHRIGTVAFPSISTGVYGYPLEEAAPIALRTVMEFLERDQSLSLVRFVLFDAETCAAYARSLASVNASRSRGGPASP